MDLNQFIEWQAAEDGRRVTIDIQSKNYTAGNEVRIWAYSTVLQEGQYVQSVEEIDLPGKVKEKELAKLAELKAKYGG